MGIVSFFNRSIHLVFTKNLKRRKYNFQSEINKTLLVNMYAFNFYRLFPWDWWVKLTWLICMLPMFVVHYLHGVGEYSMSTIKVL